jgi:UDP-N-acetylglucosamine/UDP-N-acetylgalactosamine diphosphorylase
MYNELNEILTQYGQEHLLKYYDEINQQEKKNLENQIRNIDFSLLSLIGRNDDSSEKGNIEPLGAMTINEIQKRKDEFFRAGIDAVRHGKVGAVLLAGGQGTRLGFDKPKGMFNIGINRELYIFECLVNNLMQVAKQADAWIPLYIMTSEKNNDDTVSFFREHDYFGYNKEYISFFIQEMAPSSDYSGKILLEEKDRISLSPNGNGGWFSSLKKAGLDKKMKEQGTEWINVFAVDNVLQKIADPCFIGAVILSGYKSGSKVVSKVSPDEKVGVLCLEDGRPSIVEYYEMTDDMINLRNDDGTLAYKYGVILNYLFRTDSLEKSSGKILPVHVVEKKIPYIDENGNHINPEKPNGYKFETLVLDMVHMQENCLAYEVERNREFAPVKNKSGIDSIDSARNLLIENGIEL